MVTSTDLNRNVSLASSGITQANQALNITRADLLPLQAQSQRLSRIETGGAIGRLQFPADRAKYYMTLDQSVFSRNTSNYLTGVNFALESENKITLPMPQQMVDNHSVSYEQTEIGQFTGAAVEAAFSRMASDASGTMTNTLQALTAGLTSALGGFIKGATGFDPALAGRAATGLAPNQFLTVLLKGPQYKKYEFSWKLSPRNEGESESIRKIIALLNKSMAPGLTGAQAFFTFPKVFKVGFSNEGVLYRFKPAVLENMTINYAPSGAPAFYSRTGAPDTVELRLQFLEIEFWLESDNWEGTPISTATQG